MGSNEQLTDDGMNFVPKTHHDTYPFIDPTKQNLAGKAIFITGASKGIGRQTALSFAKAGASHIALGARSSLTSLESELVAAAKEAGHSAPQVLSIVLDVTEPSSCAAAAEKLTQTFGRLDILVNNAGYLEEFVPMADQDPAEWCRTIDINLKGPYLVTRALLPLLLSSPADSLKTILNVSSIGAHKLMPGASAYQTTKLALLRFSEFVNAEYAEKGVLCYSIHPGGVMTELAKAMPKSAHGLLVDTPGLAADSVVWLTAERREWLAGRYVSVTWDMEELVKKRDEIEGKDLLKVRMPVA